MATEPSTWRDALVRESGIRRGIVVHGNVGDITPSPDGASGWISVPQAIEALLAERGYRRIIRWDRVTGATTEDRSFWRRLQSTSLGPVNGGSDSGEDYDVGSPRQPHAAAEVRSASDPLEFLTVVAHTMKNPPAESTAFILDWTSYLFGQVNGLSEAERGWLTLLGKATRDAPLRKFNASETLQPLVVLLCQGLSVLPPSLYLDNPTFGEIRVPLPSRDQRERTVLALGHALRTEPPALPHSRVLADLVDSLDGLAVRDIHNLAALSQQSEIMTPESLVSLYRFGERDSPWERLNREKLSDAPRALGERVKGQDEAIQAVNKVLIRAYTGLSGLQHSQKQNTPKGVLFFVGPTGVGKTELAKALAQFVFGDEEACIRFDMSEYNHEHSDQRLVGAPPGYVGYEEGGQLTNAVQARPFSVLLFDEVEKAHRRILDKFLQILEDGRLTDGRGKTVLFSDTIIVFTSNIGAAEIDPSEDDVAGAFIERVRAHFINDLGRPELLGRIGESNIIPFNFMTDEDFLIAIARSKLEPLRRRLKEKWGVQSLDFEDEDRALAAICQTVDHSAGGRGVLNALSLTLFDPLAEFLFNEVDSPDESEGRGLRVHQAANLPAFVFELD